jgi:hypothetical protein
MNDPSAERKACSLSWLLMISPAKAPRNVPAIKPNGGKMNIPTINPIVAPQTPPLVPPKFFVPHTGM